MNDDTTPFGEKKTGEQWALAHGHVNPGDVWDTGNEQFVQVLKPGAKHALTEYRRWIYECAKIQWGGAIHREMTASEYEAHVDQALHGTIAR